MINIQSYVNILSDGTLISKLMNPLHNEQACEVHYCCWDVIVIRQLTVLFVQENRDPNRHHWLLELLMEDPLRDEASFIECG